MRNHAVSARAYAAALGGHALQKDPRAEFARQIVPRDGSGNEVFAWQAIDALARHRQCWLDGEPPFLVTEDDAILLPGWEEQASAFIASFREVDIIHLAGWPGSAWANPSYTDDGCGWHRLSSFGWGAYAYVVATEKAKTALLTMDRLFEPDRAIQHVQHRLALWCPPVPLAVHDWRVPSLVRGHAYDIGWVAGYYSPDHFQWVRENAPDCLPDA